MSSSGPEMDDDEKEEEEAAALGVEEGPGRGTRVARPDVVN